MDQNLTMKPELLRLQSPAEVRSPLVDIVEASATKGEWTTPAVKKVSLGLALSNFSARWRGPRGLRSEDVSAGSIAICEFNQSRQFQMQSDAKFGIVMVPNEVLEQVGQGSRYIQPEIQPHDVLRT